MVKLLMMSLMKALGVENLWDNILGKKVSQAFGQECASAAIWMCFILLVRSALSVVGWTSYVPNGLLFSFPYLIQVKIYFMWRILAFLLYVTDNEPQLFVFGTTGVVFAHTLHA